MTLKPNIDNAASNIIKVRCTRTLGHAQIRTN